MPRLIPRLSAAERTAFLAAARSYLGVPFKHRGRSRRGVDCLGLLSVSLAEAGHVPQQDERLYGRLPEPDGAKLRAALCDHFGDPIPLDRMTPGCVVYMRWHRRPNHVAIVGDYYLGGLSLIHSLAEADHVVETRLADPWPRRILEAWRP